MIDFENECFWRCKKLKPLRSTIACGEMHPLSVVAVCAFDCLKEGLGRSISKVPLAVSGTVNVPEKNGGCTAYRKMVVSKEWIRWDYV